MRPTPEAGAGFRTSRLLGAGLLLLLPLAWFPTFQSPSITPKLIVLILLGAPLFWLGLRKRRDRGPTPFAPLHAFLGIGLPLLFAVSIWRAEGRAGHLIPVLWMSLGPIIALEAGRGFAVSERTRRTWALLLPLSVTPVLLVGIVRRHLGWFTFLPDAPHLDLGSTLGNSNALAEWAAPLAVFAWVAWNLGPRRARGLQLLGGLVPLAALALSNSRGGLIGFALGSLVLAVLLGRDRRSSQGARRLAAIILVVLLGLGGALALLPSLDSLRTRIFSAFDPEHPSTFVRLRIWEGTVEAISESPLLGVGIGRFEDVFPRHRRSEEWALSGDDSLVATPHNEYLGATVETGVPGLLLFGAMLLWIFRRLIVEARDGDSERRLWAHAGAACLAATLVSALFRSPAHHPSGLLGTMAVVGCALGCRIDRASPSSWVRPWIVGRIACALLVLALIPSVALDAREDYRTAHAHELLQQANEDARAGRRQDAKEHLQAAHRTVIDLVEAGFLSSSRAYRTALVARDLVLHREALGRREGDTSDLPVDMVVLRRLLDDLSTTSPYHAQARLLASQFSRLDIATLQARGDHAQAASLQDELIGDLRRFVGAVPGAPKLRFALAQLLSARGHITEALRSMNEEVARSRAPALELLATRGEIALRLGTDPASAGFYLRASHDAETTPHLTAARALQKKLFVGSDRPEELVPDALEALRFALAHLGASPADAEAITLVSTLIFGPLRSIEEWRAIGNRAAARSRLLVARGHLDRQDLAPVRPLLQVAENKDPGLYDVELLKARLGVLAEKQHEAVAAFKTLRERGLLPVRLLELLRRDPLLAPLETLAPMRELLHP